MTEVPTDPEQFFERYVPDRYRAVGPWQGLTSPGSMVFRVDQQSFSYRIVQGRLETGRDVPSDTIVQVTIPAADFEPIVVAAARAHELEGSNVEQQLLAFRALLVDAERVAMVRATAGTIGLLVAGPSERHRAYLTAGTNQPNLALPECGIECALSDFLDMQTGKLHPLQLAFAGRIKITGNAQIAMALSGVLA